MKQKTGMSRREMLVALGILGTGSLACACSGATALGLIVSKLNKQPGPTPILVTELMDTPAATYTQPNIISRDQWGADPPDHQASNESGFFSDTNPEGWRVYDKELTDDYQTVVIHHSAYYARDDLSTLLEVERQHRLERGWADIAYHFLVGMSGTIYEGRDIYVRGTHVENFNTGSLGVCLLGNFQEQYPTSEQLVSTQQLVNWAAQRLELTHIAAHRHFNPQTECPGDHLFLYIDQFAGGANLQIGTGGYIGSESAFFCPCCQCRTAT